jgi:predicted PurR-regulated permease PerM
MMDSRLANPALTLCALIAAGFAFYFARPVLEPVAFALFIVAIAWPLQRNLQARMPVLAASLVTLLVILIVVLIVASVLTWGFTVVGHWFIANASRFQAIYHRAAEGLEEHGLAVAGPLSDRFDAAWFLGLLQWLSGRLQVLATFVVVTFIFVLFGLLEGDLFRAKLATMRNRSVAEPLRKACGLIGAKMQKYMLVRTLMSVMTGAVVWAFALMAGLELATAWGAIAFALNYIPFIGPLIATVFPTGVAFVQFESWQFALVVFVALNVIQFVIGSYLEPIMTGAALSISGFAVLFAVSFWTFLWGLPGAFIGVPMTIAILTICDEFPSSRWVADLLLVRDKSG